MRFVVATLLLVLCAGEARAETCVASHYGIGDGYGGRRTASGEVMRPMAMIAAHRTLPFGTIRVVRNLANGKSVTVRIVDRGPFIRGRCLDLSTGAARAIGCGGLCKVAF
jgi:rare lipoprotein A